MCIPSREQVSDQSACMLSSREQKQVRGLHQRKIRQREGRFLAEGIRVVEDLLASGQTVRLLVAVSSLEDSERGTALIEGAEQKGVPVRRVEPEEFHACAATEHSQGVLAVADIPRGEMRHLKIVTEPAVVLVLDAVQDPGNFGTLVRTAEALGAAGVVALAGTVDPWNPKAVRAAAGSSFRIPIVETSWARAAPWLQEHGFTILAAAADGEPLARSFPRAALVVGNEGAGVSPETRALADCAVGIPLRGRAESLNVAAAAAILLHQLLR